MNTNPKAIRVLCFGDSNTHGRDPKLKAQEGIKDRYPSNVRWTGQLQDLLGDDYEIIEEGLGGRTTNLDNPDFPFLNGLTYLIPCLVSHAPLDIVVLMLGTNDLKFDYQRSAKDIARANLQLITTIKEYTNDINIILVSPPYVDETNPIAALNYQGATQKSQQLATEFQKIADQTKVGFLDLAPHTQPSHYDGLHINKKDQTKIAQLIYQKILNIKN